MIYEFYKNTTLSNKILAECLQVLLWKNKLEISKYIIKDRVNEENVDEFISTYEKHLSKNKDFDYENLDGDSKIIYNMLKCIKEKNIN